jgi:hypothetical protein
MTTKLGPHARFVVTIQLYTDDEVYEIRLDPPHEDTLRVMLSFQTDVIEEKRKLQRSEADGPPPSRKLIDREETERAVLTVLRRLLSDREEAEYAALRALRQLLRGFHGGDGFVMGERLATNQELRTCLEPFRVRTGEETERRRHA